MQHCLPCLLAPSAKLIFAMFCSKSILEQMLESCSSCPRHGNDLLMTMREASPLGFQWLQCRAWELGNANLAGGCEVVFSKRFFSVSADGCCKVSPKDVISGGLKSSAFTSTDHNARCHNVSNACVRRCLRTAAATCSVMNEATVATILA